MIGRLEKYGNKPTPLKVAQSNWSNIYEEGIYLGYPPCCAMAFALGWNGAGLRRNGFYDSVNTGMVPCPDCCKSIASSKDNFQAHLQYVMHMERDRLAPWDMDGCATDEYQAFTSAPTLAADIVDAAIKRHGLFIESLMGAIGLMCLGAKVNFNEAGWHTFIHTSTCYEIDTTLITDDPVLHHLLPNYTVLACLVDYKSGEDWLYEDFETWNVLQGNRVS